jgi:UDP-N-acetylmuramoyl-tripeptide--D-alanyl-D-alanine ligase
MIEQKLGRPSSRENRRGEEGGQGKTPSLTCSIILKTTGGTLIQGEQEAFFSGLSTDTRTVKTGEVFVALRGERFDGHAFLSDALAQGAAGAIVERSVLKDLAVNSFGSKPLIAVSDTLTALGDIAAFWRESFSLPVVCITGSNGKTSTKEMVAFLLGGSLSVLKNQGSFNNLVGLPLTLLRLAPSHEAAVLEMGTNIPGEIKRLSEIAKPTVGVITNIGQAHLEGMGSFETLIQEKGDLFRFIGREGVIVVNHDDPNVTGLARESFARQIGFGVDTQADVRIDRIDRRGREGVRFRLTVGKESVWADLKVLGLHFLHNVAAAVAVASLFRMSLDDMKRRLADFGPLPMRMEVLSIGDVTFINDTYNANPSSVEMALRTLSDCSGGRRAFAVLGDMLELGDAAGEAHRSVGRLVGELRLSGALLLGDYAADVLVGASEAGMDSRSVRIYQNHEEIVKRLRVLLRAGDWVLVKGSRRMQMETVIQRLEEGS